MNDPDVADLAGGESDTLQAPLRGWRRNDAAHNRNAWASMVAGDAECGVVVASVAMCCIAVVALAVVDWT